MTEAAAPERVVLLCVGRDDPHAGLDAALLEAAHLGLPVRLLHVVPRGVDGSAGPGSDLGRARLRQVLGRARERAGVLGVQVEVGAVLGTGEVVPVILAAAQHAAVAVLERPASVDLGAPRSASTTAALTSAITCPVLHIPHGWAPRARPAAPADLPASWQRQATRPVVTLAVDDPAASHTVIEVAVAEANLRGANLEFLRVFRGADQRRDRDLIDAALRASGRSELVVVPSTALARGPFAPAARALLQDAKCPLLVVRPGSEAAEVLGSVVPLRRVAGPRG